MFRGKIFLTNIKASDLPWTSTNRTDLGSELRPYLVISVDAVEKKRVRCEENHEDQIATNSPDWSDIFVQIPDLAENINLQFIVYHNSDIEPQYHLPVAHLDMDIATLKESMDRGTTAEQKYNENFPAGGSISFMISMKEDQAPNDLSKVPQRIPLSASNWAIPMQVPLLYTKASFISFRHKKDGEVVRICSMERRYQAKLQSKTRLLVSKRLL